MILNIMLTDIGANVFINDDQKVYYSFYGDHIHNEVKQCMIQIDYQKNFIYYFSNTRF